MMIDTMKGRKMDTMIDTIIDTLFDTTTNTMKKTTHWHQGTIAALHSTSKQLRQLQEMKQTAIAASHLWVHMHIVCPHIIKVSSCIISQITAGGYPQHTAAARGPELFYECCYLSALAHTRTITQEEAGTSTWMNKEDMGVKTQWGRLGARLHHSNA